MLPYHVHFVQKWFTVLLIYLDLLTYLLVNDGELRAVARPPGFGVQLSLVSGATPWNCARLMKKLVYLSRRIISTIIADVIYRVAQKSKLLTQYNSLLFLATLYMYYKN